MRARFAVTLVLAVAGNWVAAGPSLGLEPGVHVDPGSPAGKEYTAPFPALRGQASGSPTVEGQPGPLFGIGITPAGVTGQGGSAGAQGAPGGGTPQTPPRGRGAEAARAAHTAHAARAEGAAGARLTSAAQGPATAFPRVAAHGSDATALFLLAAAVIFGGFGLGAVIVVVRRRVE